MRGKKRTPADYHTLAEKRGFEWTGEELPRNTGTKIRWKCIPKGHEWETCYSEVQRGTGCPHCKRKLPAEYHALAGGRGLEWLGPEVPNIRTKTRWKCGEGHKFETPYSVLSCSKLGCSYCAGNTRKTLADYHALAEKCGFEWIGEELPKNTRDKTRWKCGEGHKWEAMWSSIHNGNGCPYCAGLARKISQDYRALAGARGFEWMGEGLPKNTKDKTLWRCLRGHEWETAYNNILAGNGCPTCIDIVNGVRVSKPQRRLCEMLGGELNYPCGKYRIDVVLPDRMIAIEYDCWFWHGGDKEVNDVCRAHDLIDRGWKVLRIKANEGIPSQQELDEAIGKLEGGESYAEIMLEGWGVKETFEDWRAQKRVDPWEKGPVPISLDGGTTFTDAQQLHLWQKEFGEVDA